MSAHVVGLMGLILLFFLMAIRMPISFSFLTAGFLGISCLAGLDSALAALARIPLTWASQYVFSCIPLFIISGFVIARTGIASELFDVGYKWLGRLPGGLAMATTAGVGAFSAVSGSSTACAATMSAICYPEMRRFQYSPALAAGCIAAGGGIDLMIPPSLGFVIYGILTEESIGKLLIAGIIPGVIQVFSFLFTIYVVVKLRPTLAPMRPKEAISWGVKFKSLNKLWSIFLLFLLVMGGIYLGLFTPIEAGAVGASGSIIVTAVSGRLTWKNLIESLLDASRVSIVIFMLIMGSMVFNVFMTLSKLPDVMGSFLGTLGSPTAVLACILLFYIPLGMVLDATAMMVLTIPLYLPYLLSNNINLVWFGVMLILCVEIGLITPPVGLNVYVVSGVLKEVKMETIFRGMIPFLIADIIVLVVLAAFPQLSLFLTQYM